MLRNEALWLERRLAELPLSGLDPLLSLGSGGADFRDDKQPWIAETVYAPLEQRGIRIVHHEFNAGEGVDVAGDLADPGFLESLGELGTKAVICCNVLEHLADREPLLKAFENLVMPSAHLVLTVPRRFPYHADPIDTMYRPSVSDLSAALPGFMLVSGGEVACGTLWSYLRDSPDARASVMAGLRNTIGGARRPKTSTPDASASTTSPSGFSSLRYFFRPTSVTCAVFRRVADH
jgi:hypothetical protein